MGAVRGWGRMDLSARRLGACAILSGPNSNTPGVASYGPPRPCGDVRAKGLCPAAHAKRAPSGIFARQDLARPESALADCGLAHEWARPVSLCTGKREVGR